MAPNNSIITNCRNNFHNALLTSILTIGIDGIPNIADVSSASSKAIAKGIVDRMGSASTKIKEAGQTSGKKFEGAVADFLKDSFLKLNHLRPGTWEIRDSRSSGSVEISNFEQYEHLGQLVSIIEAHPALRASLGTDYLITPDVVVLRRPETDDFINTASKVVDLDSARLTPLRRSNSSVGHDMLILHASVSCKWTIRSDRVQNSRSEALNLIRNRKGRVPHIVAVTAEPLPMRIASLALGTSDLDCVYHIALSELQEYVSGIVCRPADQLKMLNTLVDGKRLRDISDLPLDLAI